ncbi:hypothetical protein S7711_09775 [Stachybotrys chartarum IBT 7711]|uniref:Small ribosomal subunit protein uS7m n=1 Tax=Stachybotrys chartarum (strain CBS 109288 / IBT 7711) TaxID=1280523 RepID=A0A084AR91_STACB|nr:hypothetical protein S7711_09775 [Stachybotrys chartarum IBT 7711]KFA52646.1 hypothetical protein S40293_05412 [Stachybotrys chartarum IBT 40293]KFA70831.1 hypothetical protein S40288_09794 [Stachybotrys chartarum IBT 40288]
MSPPLRIWGACRAVALQSRPALGALRFARPSNRFFTNDTKRLEPNQSGPAGGEKSNAVSENAPGVENTTSSHTSPADALDDATLEKMFYGGRMVTSQGGAGLTPAQESALYQEGTIPTPAEAEALVSSGEIAHITGAIEQRGQMDDPGHKFGLPTKPYPEGFHLKKRYHPVLEQVARIMMRDGKLSAAQRNMTLVMNYLRTSPAPIYSPKFPLLPGTPPASHLPLNPILYLTIAIDSVAPLVKVRGLAGMAGGGRALDMPMPLAVRQRRRVAFQWILDAVNKRPSMGSGRKQLPHRIAEEIIAVVEGRSGVWEKRKQVHKLGTASRANVGRSKMGKKRRQI